MVAKVRKSKKVVTVALVRDAVAALSERNGSSINSIFNYLVWKRQANSGARKQAVVAIRRAVMTGVLVKKSGKGFMVSGQQFPSKPARGRKRKARRARKTKKPSTKSTPARLRRGGQNKRKARKLSKKQKVRKLSKKVHTSSTTSVARTPVKLHKRKVNRKPKSVNNAKPAPMMSARVRRKCATGIRYSR